MTTTAITPFQATWIPRALGALRIVAGYLFIAHGTTKIFQAPYIEMFANVPLASLAGIAGLLEVTGGALLILGLFTRPTAFVLSGLMAFAYFLQHSPEGFWPILNRGELAALYCFVFLYLSARGAGRYSVDAALARRRGGIADPPRGASS